MHLLKQSTAATVVVGPVLDSTGAAVTNAVVGDFKLAKEGTTATLSGATVTHDANGYYAIALTTTNTNTAGRLAIYSGNTSHSMGTARFTVLIASVYDALITNATNSAGGLATATGSITALAGAISTFNSASNTVTLAAATHTGAVIPTVTAVTNAVVLPSSATINITGNITGNVSGSVGSVTGNVGGNVVGSVGSISGVTFPSNFGSLSITVGGGVTVATNGDKTGYALTQSFPSNFASLAITSGGAVTAGTVSDKTGYSLSVAPLTSSQTAAAVWDALLSSYTVSGSFGARVTRLDSASSGNAVKVTGAGHIASDIHELQPAVINNTHFAAGAIDASAIATDAITSSKLAADSITSTQLATTAVTEIKDAIATITPIADLATMITNDGTANARYTVSALQNGPSGQGGSTINVYPVSASTPERVAGTTLTFYKNENRSVSVVTDFTLTSLTLQFVVEDAEGNDILTIADGSISRSSQTFTVTIGTSVTGTITNYKWSLRDITSGNSVLARGVLSVQDAAAADA